MTSERTLPDLTRDAALQLGDLVRHEFRLVRAETEETAKAFAGAAVTMAIGVAFATAAITLVLLALAYALSAWAPMWVSAAVAALIGGLGAVVMIHRARVAVAERAKPLARTAEHVARDFDILRESGKTP